MIAKREKAIALLQLGQELDREQNRCANHLHYPACLYAFDVLIVDADEGRIPGLAYGVTPTGDRYLIDSHSTSVTECVDENGDVILNHVYHGRLTDVDLKDILVDWLKKARS